MSEQIEWSLVKDLRVDDVVRLNYSGTSHYFGIDTRPEAGGELVANTFRGGMPEVEFWQTEMDRDMNAVGDSVPQVANGYSRVQVLVPRPSAKDHAARPGGQRDDGIPVTSTAGTVARP